MATALYSQHWHRVSDLRLRLRSHVRLHRHEYRGEPWYVIHDDLSGQVHRFTPAAYQVIGRLDGRRSLGQIWEEVSQSLGEAMPTQQELVELIGRLHAANVVTGRGDVDIDEMCRRYIRHRRARWMQMLRSPLAIRIPLFDPERFIAWTYPWVRPCIGRLGGVLWLTVVLTALGLAVLHWQALTDNVADRVLGVGNLLLLALIYPVIKALHEMGHAWATRDAGGEVHEVGVMLLVFFPIPYVDASAAAACPDKFQRMLVGAAGIMVEVFLAALAMMVWVMAEPGLVRALAFNVMLIAGVSTVLFNGNPLLRFDAYYVLADWLEIPNLAQRSNQQLGYVIRRYLLGQPQVTSQARSWQESLWLITYSLASFIYRMVIMVMISVFVATRYFIVGVLLAVWALFMTLVLPMLKMLRFIAFDPGMDGTRTRAWSWLVGALGIMLVLLFLVPVPHATSLHGVLDLGQPAQVRTGTAGMVAERWVDEGEMVDAGEPILRLEAPELSSEVLLLEAHRRELEVQLPGLIWDAPARAILNESLQLLEQRLADSRERAAAAVVTSPREGVLLMPDGVPPLGIYLERGAPVAVVMQPEDLRVRSLIPEHRGDLVREDSRQIRIRLPGGREDHESTLIWMSPAPGREIPHPALSVEGGGAVAIDPGVRESMAAFNPHYLADFSAQSLLPAGEFIHPGRRVLIRVSHDPEPLGYRLWRDTRRAFLRLFAL